MKLKAINIRYTAFAILATCYFHAAFSQKVDTVEALPFKISHLKKLSEDELENKKEGTYVTGVPDISVDPINGFGYGAEGSLIFDGKRSNPFFEYTPYLTKVDLALFNTSRNQREAILTLDKPYIFHTKWRIRGELAYEINPNLLYFGLTDASLHHLNTLSAADQVPPSTYDGTDYSGYENNLNGPYSTYNTYTKEEYILNLSGEYSLLDSKMRILAGGEAAVLNVTTQNDTLSRLRDDQAKSGILGVDHSVVTFLQLGIVYDTRDFEPDPNRGIFAEITNEWSAKFLGSDFDMDKIFGQIKWYHKLFPEKMSKMVFATRFGIGYTFGNAPFFEYQDEWSSEGSIEGLGGAHTLRGYKQSRFLDRGMFFYNAELRTKFAQFKLLKQHIALSAVPFFDAGSVYYNLTDIFQKNRLKYDEGLGLRIAWNLSTILRFDYAVSQEDHQFFFIFEQAF